MMIKRKLISTSIALCFVVLSVTGFLSFIYDYHIGIAATHTVFGFLFLVGVLFHIKNNWKGLKGYVAKKGLTRSFMYVGIVFLAVLAMSLFNIAPVSNLMQFGSGLRANRTKKVEKDWFFPVEKDTTGINRLEIELVAGEHYWHPQMAIWLEHLNGEYLTSLYVTHATAKGTFFGGRTKQNFKSFDADNSKAQEYRRVDALPVWSHKRGEVQIDGLYAPTPQNPLPDAISGATLSDNFRLQASFDNTPNIVRVLLEINVAFDDNEFYSEFDFPDDEVFHNGTGQLGQPSVVYEAIIDLSDKNKKYYLMELIGHGHHSGKNGTLFEELESLTTAKQIVERILVKRFVK